MRLGAEAFFEGCGEARLADAGFARDQHDLAVAGLGARPAPQQQVDLLVAADERRQRRPAQSLEPALDGAFPKHVPTAHRFAARSGFHCAEIAAVEQVADQTPGGPPDHHCVRLCR